MKKIALEEHFKYEIFEQYDEEAMEGNKFPALTDPARRKMLNQRFYKPVSTHRLPDMDAHNVAIHIISPDTRFVQSTLDAKKAVEVARIVNDKAYEFVNQAPERFRAFAILPMQDPEAAVEELRFRIKEQGFVGAFVHGHTHFSYYDEEKYDPIWSALEELDVPLYIHPSNPEADQIRIYDGYDELLGNTWNWGYVVATHVLRIVFGGVFERHPKAKLMIGHMGETLPYVLGRLDEGYQGRKIWEKGRISNPPSFYIKRNVYLTTSGGYRPESMHCAIESMGAEHVLFAIDYPHFPTDEAVKQIENCGLSQEEMELVYYKNAERLLKL